MATELRIRRGTTAENDAFTGAEGELTFDTERKELRIHDGETEGGIVIAMTNAGQPAEFSEMPVVDGNPIVARGSNSDGEFTIWADGSAQANARITIDQDGPFSNDSRLSGEWTYPIEFSPTLQSPAVSVSPPFHSGSRLVGCSRTEVISWGPSGASAEPTETGISFSIFFNSGTVDTTEARVEGNNLVAVGRVF